MALSVTEGVDKPLKYPVMFRHADLVLITNFLHHFDPPTCETLLRKVRPAHAPGGRALTLELGPNDARVTPPGAEAFRCRLAEPWVPSIAHLADVRRLATWQLRWRHPKEPSGTPQ